MASLTERLYVHAYFNVEGKFESWHVTGYHLTTNVKESSGFFVLHETVDVQVPVPDDWSAVREKALKALVEAETTLRAETHNQLTKMQFIRNSLLGLAAPDVLDALPAGSERPRAVEVDQDDDIPF